MDLFSISDVNHEEKAARMWLLQKHYPFVLTVMQKVPLKLPFLLENRYPRNCVLGQNLSCSIFLKCDGDGC